MKSKKEDLIFCKISQTAAGSVEKIPAHRIIQASLQFVLVYSS
jgi:hypothetical protein